jgi:hypothetical protein
MPARRQQAARLGHTVLGNLAVLQDDLQLDEAAEALDGVQVDPGPADQPHRPPLAHDADHAARGREGVAQAVGFRRRHQAADPQPSVRQADVQVADAADSGRGGVGVDVEAAHAGQALAHAGGQEHLPRPVEAVAAAGPLVHEPAEERVPGRLALEDEGVERRGSRVAQWLDAHRRRRDPAGARRAWIGVREHRVTAAPAGSPGR